MNEGRFVFADRHDRKWDTTLTLLAARRVDNSDFKEVFKGELSILEPSRDALEALTTNVNLICAIVWAIVKPQADQAGVDEDSFVDGIDGRTLTELKEAFWGSLADFFQERGTALSELIAIQKRALKKVQTLMAAEQVSLEKELDATVEREFSAAMSALRSDLGTVSSNSSPPPA
jgi:hypothetical protein